MNQLYFFYFTHWDFGNKKGFSSDNLNIEDFDDLEKLDIDFNSSSDDIKLLKEDSSYYSDVRPDRPRVFFISTNTPSNWEGVVSLSVMPLASSFSYEIGEHCILIVKSSSLNEFQYVLFSLIFPFFSFQKRKLGISILLNCDWFHFSNCFGFLEYKDIGGKKREGRN